MHAATDRLEFAPPPTSGSVRALALAILAHVFLLAALTWGLHWKREAVTITAEAELWSAVPQQAAPKLVEVPPEPPEPMAPPETRKAPITPAPPRPAPPQIQHKQPDADIALEQEKLRLKKEKQQEVEKQRLEKERLEKQRLDQLKLEKQDKLEKLEKLKQDKLKQEKLLLEKKHLQDKRDREKRDQDKKVAADKKKADQEAIKRKEALQAQQDAKNLDAQRKANIERMTGFAGATGAETSPGTALRSSGPSASYAGRVSARIKPNIVFADDIVGNPTAEVEVRTAPNGTIISRKLTKPSGDKSWDDAVLRAIDKTEKLPPDVDGRVPNALIISFKPKD